MFNAFNAQPYGANYQGWQPGYGNLQGNFGAATGQQSFQPANPSYHEHFGAGQAQYAAYGGYPQPGWQQSYHFDPYQQQQQHPHQAVPQPSLPAGPDGGAPPLPDGAPPPLPPTPAEPPPLPPDAPDGPDQPPLPPPQPQGQEPMPTLQPGQPHGSWGAPAHQQHYQHPQQLGMAGSGGWHGHHHHGPAGFEPGAPQYPSYQQPHMMPGGYPQYPYPHHPGSAYPLPAGPAAQQYPYAPALPPQPGPGPAAPLDSYHAPHQPPAMDGSGPGAAPAPAAVAAAALAPAPLAPVVVDITRLLRPPHRASRPAKLLLVLRGLPGSGKSTLARKIREAELEAGAEPPRLHSMDDYYMQEVEVEVVEEEGGRKKRKKVNELKYVYEPEMEATYFRDLVRSVGRSCEDRRHSFVVVDAPVLRAEQLRELTAAGQRANFECYVLRPLEADPAVCGAPGRNVHGHSLEALRRMADSFEEAPPLYTQVSAVSLFGGPVVGEEQEAHGGASGGRQRSRGADIQEVDMDEDDDDSGDGADMDGADDDAAPLHRRRPASRWDDVVDDSGSADGGGGEAFRDSLRRKKKAKAAARSASAAPAAPAADETGKPPGAADGVTGPATARRAASVPFKSALRRTPSRAMSLSAGDGSGGGGASAGASSPSASSAVKRRVWWPDQGLEDDGSSATASATATAAAGLQRRTPLPSSTPLAETVYLEGLGPPAELEDLPYGYQRKSTAGGPAAAAAAARGSAGIGATHQHFLEQAKAEHESEHDLFRRLLFGKQAGAGAAGAGGGKGAAGTPLGLFESAPDGDDA